MVPLAIFSGGVLGIVRIFDAKTANMVKTSKKNC
jgi:hypothetical protein